MRLPIFHVDAFAETVFQGNPAAVVPLDAWLSDAVMRSIAAETNLPVTAFLVACTDGWELRWFTPTVELDLCGHATLAAAYVLSRHLAPGRTSYLFRARTAGGVVVDVEEGAGGRLVLDFPSRPPIPTEPHPDLLPALGGPPPVEVLRAAGKYMVVYPDEAAVRALRPQFADPAGPDGCGVVVTAPASGGGWTDRVHFVSRYFTPANGMDEDPVTGSTHCLLVPYWAERLGLSRLEARQVSARGGALSCVLAGERVRIGGRAALYLEGTIHVPSA